MKVNKLKTRVRQSLDFLTLPIVAKKEHLIRSNYAKLQDPGVDTAIRAACSWLCQAQDLSRSGDGGVARHFSLIDGWANSYPETTGYIVPTMLACAEYMGSSEIKERARKMVEWLCSIQFPDGGFQGGVIGETPCVPVTFNTGQILIGLSAGYLAFGEKFKEPTCRAAEWLVNTIDDDGCWRKHPTPFAAQGEKAYESHVSWGLFEAARVTGIERYAKAARKNCLWAISKQKKNGWFKDCCLLQPHQPLTHTLGYVLRGILEAYNYTKEDIFLEAALKTANGLKLTLRSDGLLPGRLREDWSAGVNSVCLTGTVQIAACWFDLGRITKNESFITAAKLANSYVRKTVDITTRQKNRRGGVSGSYPRYGEYGSYQYLNWAAKFFIDSNFKELYS